MNYTTKTIMVAVARQKSPRKHSKNRCAFLLSGNLLAGPAHAVDAWKAATGLGAASHIKATDIEKRSLQWIHKRLLTPVSAHS
ncbi:hypothetical protein GFL39_34790 [Rhizobium leguminosarum bv. viciae]|uniref:hypothetical protein n=1 Tax=Rhizobium leguminosarum TaxID=384 RepID=UPI001441FDC6|nr:hypothetical protein [Rhizobium leguminosarum]NKL09963.1 hypothetical protein [Rhizobium leguminosarum bv. viciae]NKL90472.1 hypothetical protein [Rhizobium leguminosarum bv. viciae]